MIYRKIPTEVDAIQWTGLNVSDVSGFLGRNGNSVSHWGEIKVTTIHGDTAVVRPGDWIIREQSDSQRYYPCKPDIFEATYEEVK